MESFLIKALQLILSLSILVLVHEFGHFIFARIFKVRVEKFYLFFNPWFSLFKFKPKNSDTEYGIGWLPLGGYVKIAGMMDESMDKDQMAEPEKPWEFRSKPAGQRLLIMIAGVVFNFLLALFIYSMICFTWGETYLPLKNAKAGMLFSDAAQEIGFKNGDILLSADGVELENYSPETMRFIAESKEVEVLRGREKVEVKIPQDFMLRLLKGGFAGFINPVVIDSVMPGHNAAKAGLMPGDSLVMINGGAIPDFSDLSEALTQNKGRSVQVSYYRDNMLFDTNVDVDTLGKMGFFNKSLGKIYPLVTIQYSFWESFPKGIERGVNTLTGYVGDMKYVFTKEGATSVGGFGMLASIFPDQWNWLRFWEVTAFLSVILAFMNILPIPALDGGHVLFLMYEVITRRKPNEKFMEYSQIAGMVFLFGLLIYANGSDLFRFIFK